MLTDQILKSKIDSLWDMFWSGGISNPLSAIEQMSYLIFLKRLEDKDNERKRTSEKRNLKHDSVFDKSIGDIPKKEIQKCMNLTTSGKNGQFRTPRHIIRMIVQLV